MTKPNISGTALLVWNAALFKGAVLCIFQALSAIRQHNQVIFTCYENDVYIKHNKRRL